MKKVLLILGILGILFVGGCVAIVALVADSADEALSEEEDNNTPSEIDYGKEFTHDEWTVAGGWSVKKDVLGDAEVAAKVTNDAGEARSALLTINFLKGSEVVMSVDCSSPELEAGQSAKLSCLSTDDFAKKYDTVTVQDAF